MIAGFSDNECETQKSLMQAKLTALEEEAYQLAGHPFSLTSTEDISQVKLKLFSVLSLEVSEICIGDTKLNCRCCSQS